MTQLLLDLKPEQPPTLDNFVAGANGELISRLRGLTDRGSFDAVYLWGASGCGKSHLLAATLAAARRPSLLLAAGDVGAEIAIVPGMLLAIDDVHNATHATIGTTGCETCHRSTVSWTSGVSYSHSAANAVGSGTCDTCHNGATAKGKSAAHIPITVATAKCDACHRSQASFATSVTMSHTAVTGMSCKLCHNGSYTSQGTQGALAKPTNHIPEAQLLNGASMDCNACHTSTTAWSTQRMNHNNSMGNGAGWCKACHQTGTSYLGSMEKKSLTHEKKTPVPTDCSMSGCHRPLGSKGAAYTKWD